MPSIRSVLWIGRGRRFAGDLVADAPTLDVAGGRRRDARPGAGFRRAGCGRARCRRRRGRPAGPRPARRGGLARPPCLVRIAAAEAEAAPALRAAGAADVLLRSASDRGRGAGRAHRARPRRAGSTAPHRRLGGRALPRHRRPEPRHARRLRPGRAGGGLAGDGAAERRDRHRQGARRPGDPRPQRAPARARASWRSTARPSPRRCSSPSSSATPRAPSPAPTATRRASSRPPTAAPSFSTR